MERKSIDSLGLPGLDQHFIGGEWVKPAVPDLIDVIYPATGETVAQVAAVTVADADTAVEAAAAAFADGAGEWASMDVSERIAICRRFVDGISARLDAIVNVWSQESGPTQGYSEVINRQISPMVWDSALEAGKQFVKEEVRNTPTGECIISHEPIGTVLTIYAYNGPLVYIGMKVVPALIAGNCVIAKPAQESQLTSRLVADAAREAGFPRGVISVLPAGPEATQHLVSHPKVDMVSLTAGTAIARDVLDRTRDRIGRTTLELGGKSAAVILDDADFDSVIPNLVPSAVGYCGQVCITLSRILISRPRYEEFVTKLGAAYSALKIGEPFADGVDLGPLGAERTLTRTEGVVAEAVKSGARIVAGGKRPEGLDGGWYYEPTLLADVTNDMPVARNEIFGPVTVAIPYDDVDDAVRIANDSEFGLAASVYTSDPEAGQAVARRIRAGAVSVNQAGMCITEPYGGFKQSGFGREGGIEGILGYTEIRQMLFAGGSLWDA